MLPVVGRSFGLDYSSESAAGPRATLLSRRRFNHKFDNSQEREISRIRVTGPAPWPVCPASSAFLYSTMMPAKTPAALPRGGRGQPFTIALVRSKTLKAFRLLPEEEIMPRSAGARSVREPNFSSANGAILQFTDHRGAGNSRYKHRSPPIEAQN